MPVIQRQANVAVLNLESPRFAGDPVLERVFDGTLELQRGSFLLAAAFASEATGVTALYGRSGSGKTSLVGALAGLLRPQHGRISLDGRALFDSAARLNLFTGVVSCPKPSRVMPSSSA